MKKVLSTKKLCRAGIIAALYVALTYAFAPFAFGPLQIRPAEALCILPLFFPEAIPALFIGCILSNLASPFLFYDVVFGGLATLLAALNTYVFGSLMKKRFAKLLVGGIFPVLFNSLIIPFVIVFLCGEGTDSSIWTLYFSYMGSIAFTEAIWVYGLGSPIYFTIQRLQNNGKFLY